VHKDILQVEDLVFKGDNKKALDLVKKIIKKEGLTNEDKLVCTMLETRIIFKLGEREKAIKKAEKIWPEVQKLENPLAILDYLILKTSVYWLTGEIDNGINFLEEHLSYVSELQEKVLKNTEKFFKLRQSDFLRNAGVLYWYKGVLDISLEHHEQSLAISEKLNHKKNIRDSYNNIGLVFFSKGESEKAIEYYTLALNVSRDLGMKERDVRILSNLGNVYTSIGDLDKALEIQQEGLEIRQKFGNKRNSAISLINIGVVFQLKGEIDQALDYYQKSLALSEETDFKSNIALALNNIGSIYATRGDPSLAVEYFERSLKIYRELGINEKIALLLVNIGNCFRQKGEIKEAFDNFDQSLKIYEEIGNNFSSAIVLLELLQAALEQKDLQLVQKCLEKFHQINISANIRSIDYRFRLAKALTLKISDQLSIRSEAKVLFEQLIEEEIVDHSLTVKAMVNLCDMLIKELMETAEIMLLKKIKDLLQKLQSIAEEQSSDSILAEVYRLKALLALAELDLKESRDLLQKGLTLAEEKKLENIASNLRGEQKRLEDQIMLWEGLQERKAPLKETLQYVKIEESMKQLQHEETDSYRKLFSLKI
jgi:tetratricopeptide (TPR) repeat protein